MPSHRTITQVSTRVLDINTIPQSTSYSLHLKYMYQMQEVTHQFLHVISYESIFHTCMAESLVKA